MKTIYWGLSRLLPATLGCLLAVTVATAQDNVPLAEGGQVPGYLPEYGGQPMNPDVFYNLYPNTMAGATSAQAYVAPLPVPAHVGHTYYTYQPLMPHEHLYAHKRVYYTPYGGASQFYQGGPYGCGTGTGYGLNKTTVTWQYGAHHFGHAPFNIFPMENLRSIGYGLRSHSLHGHFGGCSNCR